MKHRNFADRAVEINNAKVFKSGKYFLPGRYRVKIQAVKWVKASVGTKEFVIIETEVLTSTNVEIPPGSERSQVIDMTNVMGMSNVKAFVAAVSGVDSSSTDTNVLIEKYWEGLLGSHVALADICDTICSDDNPLNGEEIDLECIETKKRDGDPFTKYNWVTVPRD